MELPKSRLGRKSYISKIDGDPTSYEVIDEEIFLAPSNNRKAFCLHKLRFDDGREEFRIAYYMIAEKPRMRGKWSNEIDGGFAGEARVPGADHFIVHPDVFNRLFDAFAKEKTDEIFVKDFSILEQLAEIKNPAYSQRV